MGYDFGDVIGMLWERVGEDLFNEGDGVINWWLVVGDGIGRLRELVGDWVKFWVVVGEGWRRVESWGIVI